MGDLLNSFGRMPGRGTTVGIYNAKLLIFMAWYGGFAPAKNHCISLWINGLYWFRGHLDMVVVMSPTGDEPMNTDLLPVGEKSRSYQLRSAIVVVRLL